MKSKIFLALAFVGVIASCQKQEPINSKVSKMPPATDLADDEVETKEVHRHSPARIAAEPNFWDPNYRSYRTVNTYVEVDYEQYKRWGVNSETNIRKAFQMSSNILERLTGLKINVVLVKTWNTADPYASYTSAGTILNLWGNDAYNIQIPFKHFVSGKNLGGIAYISRGNVTSAKFAISSTTEATVGDDQNYSFLIYCIMHELLHNLGISHTQNDCAWLDQAGNRLGRLDYCYSCESTCTPLTSTCTGFTQSMDGGINSYCHLYGRLKYILHPAVLAVLHRSLWYSDLPTYTPTAPPPSPSVVISPTSYLVSGGAYSSGTLAAMFDGKWTTNVSRYVLKDSMIVNFTFSGQILDSVQLFTGWLSGSTWTSPVAKVSILRNGVWTTNVRNNPVQKGYSLGSVATTAVRIKFGPGDFARVREIRFWGKN